MTETHLHQAVLIVEEGLKHGLLPTQGLTHHWLLVRKYLAVARPSCCISLLR